MLTLQPLLNHREVDPALSNHRHSKLGVSIDIFDAGKGLELSSHITLEDDLLIPVLELLQRPGTC